MKWDTLDEEPRSLSRTVAVVGDRWTRAAASCSIP